MKDEETEEEGTEGEEDSGKGKGIFWELIWKILYFITLEDQSKRNWKKEGYALTMKDPASDPKLQASQLKRDDRRRSRCSIF